MKKTNNDNLLYVWGTNTSYLKNTTNMIHMYAA